MPEKALWCGLKINMVVCVLCLHIYILIHHSTSKVITFWGSEDVLVVLIILKDCLRVMTLTF